MSSSKPLPRRPEPSSFYDDILPSYQMPERAAPLPPPPLPPPPSQTPDELAVLETCYGFTDCVNRKQPRQMNEFMRPDGHAALRRYDKKGTVIQHLTLGEMVKRLEHMIDGNFKTKRIEETFDEPEVRVDEDLAMVWSGFRLKIEGKVVAKGRKIFTLHRSGVDPARAPRRGWKISMVADRNVPVL